MYLPATDAALHHLGLHHLGERLLRLLERVEVEVVVRVARRAPAAAHPAISHVTVLETKLM